MSSAADSSLQRVCAAGYRDVGSGGAADFPQCFHQKMLKLFTNCLKLSLLDVSLQEQNISPSYKQDSSGTKAFPWWEGSFSPGVPKLATKPPPDVLVFLMDKTSWPEQY